MQQRIKTIFYLSCLMMAGFNRADEIKAPGEDVTLNIGGSLKNPMCTVSSATYTFPGILVRRFDRLNLVHIGRVKSNIPPLKDCSAGDKFNLHLTFIKKHYYDDLGYYGYVPLEEGNDMAQGVALYVDGYSEEKLGENFQRLVNDSVEGMNLSLHKKGYGRIKVTAGKILGKVIATLTPL